MLDLTRFGVIEIGSCALALRHLAEGSSSIEEAAGRVVQHLREALRDGRSGRRQTCLVRFYMTLPVDRLEPEQVAFARSCLTGTPLQPTTKCLTLLATAGDLPAWNDRRQSRGHKAIPLPSDDVLARTPMIAQLIRQLGMEVTPLLHPEQELLIDAELATYNVFHVGQALGSPHIPAQADFVEPFGVQSVVGFGGLLPYGEMFAVVLFALVVMPRSSADLFQPLGPAVRAAIERLDRRAVFSHHGPLQELRSSK